MATQTEHAEVVAKRRAVLAALATPTRKPELVEQLSASRSTIDRAIDELQEAGLVTRTDSRYLTTYAGREALSAYESYLDRVEALGRAQPVLSALPPTVDIDPAALEGATVVESTPAAPEAPTQENADIVQSSTTFRGTGPTVLPRYIDSLSALLDDGTAVELVVTESVVEALSETYAEGFETLVNEPEMTMYVTGDAMPYAVWTAESPDRTESGIVVYDETGVVGVINNDTDAMNEWATAEYERFKRDATPLD